MSETGGGSRDSSLDPAGQHDIEFGPPGKLESKILLKESMGYFENALAPQTPGERSRAASLGFLSILSVLVLALAVLASLFIYKWGSAYRVVGSVQSSGLYNRPPERIATAGLPLLLASGARTINYLATVWPALLFGILIAGLVRAFISPKNVTMLLGSGVVRQQFVGGIVGMPLMLCSCCVAPIFSSVYSCGARLGSALGIMFSSPSLNVAALLLTFLLFPSDLTFARIAMALFAVFALPVFIERLASREVGQETPAYSICPSEGRLPQNPLTLIKSWVISSGSIAVRTLPLIVLGVYASGFLVGWFEHPSASGASTLLVIAVVAFLATLTAMPTFFEIPFGMLLLASGFPQGAVAAMIFAGPAINMPSLFTLARVTSRKVALLAFLGVWTTATVGGLLLELWRT